MDSAEQMTLAGKACKEKHDIQSQNMFRRVVGRAEERVMVVNKGKMKILCVSDAQTYKASAAL